MNSEIRCDITDFDFESVVENKLNGFADNNFFTSQTLSIVSATTTKLMNQQ